MDVVVLCYFDQVRLFGLELTSRYCCWAALSRKRIVGHNSKTSNIISRAKTDLLVIAAATTNVGFGVS